MRFAFLVLATALTDCYVAWGLSPKGRKSGPKGFVAKGEAGPRKVSKAKTARDTPRKPLTTTLPAGTLVKHGTTSDLLPAIFKRGLVAREPDTKRFRVEAVPKSEGVYVARSFGAYGAAFIRSSNAFYAPSIDRRARVETPQTFCVPVVLNIVLREDCTLVLDEDYDQTTPRVAADELWAVCGSGALVRAGGLPADWIESVESPHLLSANALGHAYDFMAFSKDMFGKHNPMVVEHLLSNAVRDKFDGLDDDDAQEELLALFDDVMRFYCGYDLVPGKGASITAMEGNSRAWESMTKESHRLLYRHPQLAMSFAGPTNDDRDTLDDTSRSHPFTGSLTHTWDDRGARLLQYFEEHDGADGALLADFFYALSNYVFNQVRRSTGYS